MKMPANYKNLPKPLFRVEEKTEQLLIKILNWTGIGLLAVTIAVLIRAW